MRLKLLAAAGAGQSFSRIVTQCSAVSRINVTENRSVLHTALRTS